MPPPPSSCNPVLIGGLTNDVVAAWQEEFTALFDMKNKTCGKVPCCSCKTTLQVGGQNIRIV